MSVRLEENSRLKAVEYARAKKDAKRMYELKHMEPEDIADVIEYPLKEVEKMLGLVKA